MSDNLDDYRGSTDDATSSQWVLPDAPIIKTSNPYKSSPEYLCPHCVCNITPQSSVWADGGEEDAEEVPQEVERHIRNCTGLEPYHLGLTARRKQKARELAKRR
jgi:hypothetical protein